MRVLLVSTYELGHQPLHLASPAAALTGAGHEVRTLDTSVEPWDTEAVSWAEAVAFSTPMHTAMRLALRAAASVRATRPGLPICLYGLYAGMGWERTAGAGLADHAVGGEYERGLVAWVEGLAGTAPAATLSYVIDLGRGGFRAPQRDGLPALDRYARLDAGDGGEHATAGYVEASHGCIHRCRHCPVPVVYDGRLRIVPEDVVLADVEAQVAAGAGHITFGDPDFLNGPHHALRVAKALHRRFPEVTFDCTTKVSHILRHDDVWGDLSGAGCLFVVSAFECVNDRILERLDKGHTTADAAAAVALLRRYGIEIRPSFMPFTPWTTMADMVALVDFVGACDLVGNVDPVQYTIRLLLPEGSLLLGHPDLAEHLGPYDAERLGYTWAHPDPAVDALADRLRAVVAESLQAGEAVPDTYRRIRRAVSDATGTTPSPDPAGVGPTVGRPRLTEPWFCCAEPTEDQFGGLG
ncbi:MAG: CUAEP/CCAEP-tail radical SAM (seleno)protein [Acidimicrobiia bacterium]